MYMAHGWCSLADNTYEADAGHLEGLVGELRVLVEAVRWSSLVFDLRRVNGFWVLNLTCCSNRERGEAAVVDDVLTWIATRLPGSYGLVFDRDDDLPEPYGNQHRVRVIARGLVIERPDPFLSPARPVIED